MRQNISGSSPWEAAVGFRVGAALHVAGTTAPLNGKGVGVGDAYQQTKVAPEMIQGALAGAGARLEDVSRTRIFVTDISRWEEVGRAHGEVFGSIRRAATLVQVAASIDPEHLVEIEAEAVIP